MRLLSVPPDSIDAWWPLVLPFAEKMAERFPDDWPTFETLRQARSGLLRLWLAHDEGSKSFVAAAGTKLIRKPSGKLVIAIRWCAGNGLGDFLPLIRGIEADGKAQGCTAIEIDPGSRAGWARALPDYRARPSVMLTKAL